MATSIYIFENYAYFEKVYAEKANELAFKVDLVDLLHQLNRFEIRSILVEGGATLIGSLLDERLVDKAMVFVAPILIGGKEALTSVGGKGIARLKRAIKLKEISTKSIKGDLLIEGDLEY